MNSFHKFLLRHRRYCEKCNVMTLTPATEVIRENGHEIAVCKIHAEPFRPIQTGLNRQHERITRADIQTTGEKIPYFGHMRKRQ